MKNRLCFLLLLLASCSKKEILYKSKAEVDINVCLMNANQGKIEVYDLGGILKKLDLKNLYIDDLLKSREYERQCFITLLNNFAYVKNANANN